MLGAGGGGGGVSHTLQLTTGLVIKSVTTSPTLAGEHMLFILQVSILLEQIQDLNLNVKILYTKSSLHRIHFINLIINL